MSVFCIRTRIYHNTQKHTYKSVYQPVCILRTDSRTRADVFALSQRRSKTMGMRLPYNARTFCNFSPTSCATILCMNVFIPMPYRHKSYSVCGKCVVCVFTRTISLIVLANTNTTNHRTVWVNVEHFQISKKINSRTLRLSVA